MSTQRLVKTFCDLVSTGSETGHERAFCIELEKALIEAGFEVERDEEAGKKCGILSKGAAKYGHADRARKYQTWLTLFNVRRTRLMR